MKKYSECHLLKDKTIKMIKTVQEKNVWMVLNDHWMIAFLCVKKIYNIVYNKSISFTGKVTKVESHS